MTYKEFLAQGDEKKWQDHWLNTKIDQAEDFSDKPKKYVLDMFPYPSGVGLHVGHPEGYTATDIYSRYLRLKGFNVLHPMGWDAYGLPAENYAIKTGTHPKITTEKNIATFKKQIQSLGFSYDWDREIDTTDKKYYKWTQWIFLQLFKKGLAYEATVPINFCPSCKTGLANEEVKDGKCDRCGTEVERKSLRQWMLKITAYADRLLDGIDKLDWPQSIKTLQKNWIGRSEGAEVDFRIAESEEKITVYTTRPDTLFGATYMVLAPEHQLVQDFKNKITNFSEVEDYIKKSKNKSDLERTELNKDKTGVELKGIKAINPVNNNEIPIWISDYVLVSYGTGAIMAVPAHDERDFEFAQKFNIEIKYVITPDRAKYLIVEKSLSSEDYRQLKNIFTENKIKEIDKDWGELLEVFVDSNQEKELLNFLSNKLLTEKNDGGSWYADSMGSTNFIVFNNKIIDANSSLGIEEFKNYGRSIGIVEEQLDVEFKCNTEVEIGKMINSEFLNGLVPEEAIIKMITWLEEKGVGKKAINYKLRDWVFSRQRYWGEPIPLIHCDKCGIVPLDESDLPLELPEVEKYEPTGTGESPLANIKDWVNTTCPKCNGIARRETNTMPQWAGSSWYWLRYIDPQNDQVLADQEKLKYWLPVDLYLGGAEHAVLHLLYARFWNMVLFDLKVVPFEEPFAKLINQGLILGEDGEKMSKSRGNVVNPDDIVKEYGADTFRMYEMFMGPLEDMKPWSTKNILGVHRFLNKVWESFNFISTDGSNEELDKLIHKTIEKVGEDIEKMNYNTAISMMMVLVNKIQEVKNISSDDFKKFLIILAPFAPHMCEELWQKLGSKESIFKQAWPNYDENKIIDEEVEIVVQVNGKVRAKMKFSVNSSEEEIKKTVLDDENVKKYLSGEPKKIIFVKGKLISIVV